MHVRTNAIRKSKEMAFGADHPSEYFISFFYYCAKSARMVGFFTGCPFLIFLLRWKVIIEVVIVRLAFCEFIKSLSIPKGSV